MKIKQIPKKNVGDVTFKMAIENYRVTLLRHRHISRSFSWLVQKPAFLLLAVGKKVHALIGPNADSKLHATQQPIAWRHLQPCKRGDVGGIRQLNEKKEEKAPP